MISRHNLMIVILILIAALIVLLLIVLFWEKVEWDKFIMAAATVVIALATVQSCNISNKLADLQSEGVQQEHVRLQAELRPYVVPQLVPDNSNLFRDGNSKLFLNLYNKQFLVIPIVLTNVGKIPAMNIKATYDSPTQSNVPFELGDNTVLPESQPTALYRPWINIYNQVHSNLEDPFEISIKVTYKGLKEVDPRNCYSILKLKVKRSQESIYEITEKDFDFGLEKI